MFMRVFTKNILLIVDLLSYFIKFFRTCQDFLILLFSMRKKQKEPMYGV